MLQRFFVILIVSGCLAIGTLAQSSPATDSTPSADLPTRTADIAYVPEGHPKQKLDVYLPDERDTSLPTLFLLHGGGFAFGDKEMFREVSLWLVERGYAVVVPSYRLTPTFTYPAQINDAFCALAWTVTHADEYGLDTSQMVLVGESAGANLAALLALVDTPQQYLDDCPHTLPEDYQPQGVVAYYMPVDLSTCGADDCGLALRMSAAYLGVTLDALDDRDNSREIWEAATPLAWLNEENSNIPFLLIHGSADRVIPPSESDYFAEAYREVGGDVTFEVIDGARHGFFGYMGRRSNERTLPLLLDFVAQVLGKSSGQEK